MGLLKRKEEKTETIAVRVPSSLKAQLEELRDRADAAGFDLTATIAESITRLAKQVREELDAAARTTQGQQGRGSSACEWSDASWRRAFSRGQRQRR